jgi:hypothetical protein
MKEFKLTEVQVKELMTFLGTIPFNIANPLIQFLDKALVEIKVEEEIAKPELVFDL